jgi:hypothetical protein
MNQLKPDRLEDHKQYGQFVTCMFVACMTGGGSIGTCIFVASIFVACMTAGGSIGTNGNGIGDSLIGRRLVNCDIITGSSCVGRATAPVGVTGPWPLPEIVPENTAVSVFPSPSTSVPYPTTSPENEPVSV